MDISHNLELGLKTIGELAKLIMEGSSVFCIILGFFLTFMQGIKTRQFINVRLQFGTWLSLALEFQLAADILGTTIAPNLNDIYKLAIVSVIRTFLNFREKSRKKWKSEEDRWKCPTHDEGFTGCPPILYCLTFAVPS
jgi:uncharacterized membrane protein